MDIKPHILTMAIDLDDGTASLNLAFGVAEDFELDPKQARAIAAEVGAVSGHRYTAGWNVRLEHSHGEIERMTSAFEHDEVTTATAH